MSEQDIRIVKLPSLRVAWAHAYSSTPENDAWNKLMPWAKSKGLLDDPQTHRIFGFNNPDPSAGSPNYGYEFWIVVGPELVPEGEIKIKTFEGGLYAVLRCEVRGNAYEEIPQAWQRLVAWFEASRYKRGQHQWLEEHIGPADIPQNTQEFTLDLFMPIAE